MRIGLISDTHSAGSGSDLPSEVLRALEGVDLILHCGDLECLGVLNYLEAVAPVLAVRGYEDPIEKGNRLAARSTRIVQAEDISIGMVHDIQWPGPKIPTSPDGTRLGLHPDYSQSILSLKFGGEVDVVVFGDTHEEMVCYWDNVLLVNPGSPTFPGRRHRRGELGTIGFLDVERKSAKAQIFDLETGSFRDSYTALKTPGTPPR